MNNPLRYVDESGEFIITAIIVGALVGGGINLGIKAIQGKIHSVKDGFVAFGIGAVAGAIGAATGGSAFVAAGGAAAGAGGFLAGMASGAVGTAFSSPILSLGNSAYFGDPIMTGQQYLLGVAMGGAIGGAVNGVSALVNGKSFWNGTQPTPKPNPVITMPDVNKDQLISKPKELNVPPNENSFKITTSRTETPNYILEGQSNKITIQRPEINGYNPRLTEQLDLYHNFPSSFDKTIIKEGLMNVTNDGGLWFSAPGAINGTNGVYTIGINAEGIIYHRCFYDYILKIH